MTTATQKQVVETYENETDELIHVYLGGEEIVTTPVTVSYGTGSDNSSLGGFVLWGNTKNLYKPINVFDHLDHAYRLLEDYYD